MTYATHSINCKGLTLIELMVALFIVAVLSYFFMWHFADFLALNRADNRVSLLHGNITYARLYAINNNTYVTLCTLENNECQADKWQKQIAIFVDEDKSLSLNGDELMLSIFEHTHPADSLTYPRNAITFRPDGSLNGFQNGTFVYCPNKIEAKLTGTALTISQTGRIRIKDTNKCQQ